MEFLGVGPLELLFILLIALILLGPSDMVKAGRTLARIVRQVLTSDGWKTFMQASNQIRTLPNEFLRDAGLDDIQNQLQQTINQTRQIAEETQKDLRIESIIPPETIPSPPAPAIENPPAEVNTPQAETISAPQEAGAPSSDQPVWEEASSPCEPEKASDCSDQDLPAFPDPESPPKTNSD